MYLLSVHAGACMRYTENEIVVLTHADVCMRYIGRNSVVLTMYLFMLVPVWDIQKMKERCTHYVSAHAGIYIRYNESERVLYSQFICPCYCLFVVIQKRKELYSQCICSCWCLYPTHPALVCPSNIYTVREKTLISRSLPSPPHPSPPPQGARIIYRAQIRKCMPPPIPCTML